LLGHAEGILAADGVEFLQVKTLAPSKPDDGYDKTRAFYLAYGFRPLEEFRDLWDAENPATDDQGHSETGAGSVTQTWRSGARGVAAIGTSDATSVRSAPSADSP
jgi:hypothetical protein